ncbi:hypothetical protein AAJ76_153000717 [Vairimorpha ceranae]|uniref:Uncharacterized protein n=1 Tax=Vairimorpha ceranae TaxID=40302 RepID=A0A0F9W8C5_9MICR|nr:hypothetical protein AAJ76_153000717 [Vairimorpha ceranae]KKO73976.1 hypothetical protein AAJ76_153000717 [Vairimorpha ceranae]
MEKPYPLYISKILDIGSFLIKNILKIVYQKKLYFKYLQKKDNY